MPATYAQIQAAIQFAGPVAFAGQGRPILPGDTPKAIQCPFDFSATNIPNLPNYGPSYYIDTTPYIQLGKIKGVLSIYIDNSNNNGFVTVANADFSQQFSLPAGYQGYFDVLSQNSSGGRWYIFSTTASLAGSVYLLNVAMGTQIWAAKVVPLTPGLTQPVSDAILEALVVAGRYQVRSIDAQASFTDHSSTIAVANTSQLLMAANSARRGFLIENVDTTNLESLWICFGAGPAVIGAAGSYSLAQAASAGYPGGSFQGIVSDAIQVIATTAGHKFSAMEW